MGFLFPEFLFAWLLMAIPVIIHLFNFRKFKKVYFTNVQFLKEVQLQTSSSQKLKERLILATRMLAIFFLVLAFAQPYIKSNKNQNTFQKNIISIYLDNSYSMEAVNKNGSLLDEGKRKIKEITEAYTLNDKYQLLTNDFDGKQQRLLSKDELLEELNDVKISPLVRAYQSIIHRQQEVLLKENQVKRIAYLLSDFQTQDNEKLLKDSSVHLKLIPLLANELPNISVDSVYFLSPIHQPDGKENLVAVISNHSVKDVENIPVKLSINGVQKSLGSVNLKAGQQRNDTLDFSGLTAGWQKGEVTIKDYPITFDDRLNFTFEVKAQVPILSVYQGISESSIAYAYETDPFFDFKESNESQINYSGLSTKQLIILENLKTIAPGLGQQLKKYTEKGGSLSVFIPLNADLKSYQQFMQSMGADGPLGLKKETIKAKKLNLQHPLFNSIFDQIPNNPDLPVTSQYFTASNFTRTTKQVLISGDGNIPLLNTYQIGRGKLYVSFMPLEEEASNFSRHALFLPVLFRMALLGANQQTLFYTIGEQVQASIPDMELAESEVLKIRNEDIEIIPELRKTDAGASLYLGDQIKKAGFYEVYSQNKLIAVFAFNEDRRESPVKFYDQESLENIFGIQRQEILKGEKPINQQIEEVNLGSSLWKLCLILAILFLITEILLIRFFKNQNVKS
ncbi:MAG: BatA domain-containing protein [Pelobium sp.]